MAGHNKKRRRSGRTGTVPGGDPHTNQLELQPVIPCIAHGKTIDKPGRAGRAACARGSDGQAERKIRGIWFALAPGIYYHGTGG